MNCCRLLNFGFNLGLAALIPHLARAGVVRLVMRRALVVKRFRPGDLVIRRHRLLKTQGTVLRFDGTDGDPTSGPGVLRATMGFSAFDQGIDAINTIGASGLPLTGRTLHANIKLVSGPIGDHGITVLLARGDLDLEADLRSDTRSVFPMVEALAAAAGTGIRWMRDPTRGGVATSLNELSRMRLSCWRSRLL